jgi:hypothetical protein
MRRVFANSFSTKFKCLHPVPSDIDISQSVIPEFIGLIAEKNGILPEEYNLYGKTKAKISLDVRDRLKTAPFGNYVVVTSINPTRKFNVSLLAFKICNVNLCSSWRR